MADAKIDAEQLMNQSVKFAERMLRQEGEFLPYGAAMKPDGKIVISGPSEEIQNLPGDALVQHLRDSYKEAATQGTYKATATIYHGHTAQDENGESTNAIVFELDHRDNYSVVMYWAYKLEEGEIHYAQFFSQPGERRIF